MNRLVLGCMASIALLACQSTLAYERDVHFGLTRWLAIDAGFEPGQADAIARGNQRVDGGLMDTLAMTPEFACASPSRAIALEQQQRHFPSNTTVPASASSRKVVPGDESAKASLRSLASAQPGRALQLLEKLGASLHPLQDSWAHRGVPGGAGIWGRYLKCDENLVSFHGSSRGLPETHDADLTLRDPEDLVEAARATYEVLRAYPPLLGKTRTPKTFEVLIPSIRFFAEARTKSAKKAWFVSQGFSDTRFLAGTSLPDGQVPFAEKWDGSRLPQLSSNRSQQHDMDTTARAFFDGALAEWLSAANLDALASRLIGQKAAPQIALRLKLWVVRDHGSAAPFLHGSWPLQGAKLRRAEALTANPQSLVRTSVADAVVPLQAIATYATPLLPYVLCIAPVDKSEVPRALAFLRFVHAPYDTVALVAERRANTWKLVDVIGSPDH